MKNLLKSPLIILIFFSSACYENKEIETEDPINLALDYKSMLEGTNFFNSTGYELDFDEILTQDFENGLNTALIPIERNSSNERDYSSESYIAPIINDNNDFRYGLYIENKSNMNFSDDDFTGKVQVAVFDQFSTNYQTLTFSSGAITDIINNEEINNESGRVECCGCSVRGVSYCVGDKFENPSGIAEEATCYIGFALCIIARYVDCTIQECEEG